MCAQKVLCVTSAFCQIVRRLNYVPGGAGAGGGLLEEWQTGTQAEEEEEQQYLLANLFWASQPKRLCGGAVAIPAGAAFNYPRSGVCVLSLLLLLPGHPPDPIIPPSCRR
ncbi:hypothetical protein GPALN_014683 [Globodera pallida]|nr:hypothetical protein GPALN_014683 [Globodera pallida]